MTGSGDDALRFPDAVPLLDGNVAHLRALAEDDIPAWYARATDRESAALAGDPVPATPEEGSRWLQRHRDRIRAGTGIQWAIVPTGGKHSVGSIGLTFAPGEDRSADIGFVIGRADWGRGLGTCAARLVARFAFESLGIAVLRAETLATNTASRRVLEKAGFRLVHSLPGFDTSEHGSEDGALDERRFTADALAPSPASSPKEVARVRGAYVIDVQADLGDEAAIALYSKLGTREDMLHSDIAPRSRTPPGIPP